jgi:ribosomal subunit interface protein
MKIGITGKNIEIGDSLHKHIKDKLNQTSDFYLKNVIWMDVVISKHSHMFHVDIIMHDAAVGTIKAVGENDEVYSAFDSTLLRIEKQLRKYKHRIIKKHRKSVEDGSVLKGTKYVISSIPKEEEEELENDQPLTIAEKTNDIENMTVSEAIMQMDLRHLPALLFINIANGRLNVVYYRKDGNISWVDPGGVL